MARGRPRKDTTTKLVVEKQQHGTSVKRFDATITQEETPTMKQWPTLTLKDGVVTLKSNPTILDRELQRSHTKDQSSSEHTETRFRGHKCQMKVVTKGPKMVSKWIQKPIEKLLEVKTTAEIIDPPQEADKNMKTSEDQGWTQVKGKSVTKYTPPTG
ncbi:hypothetical protein HAX54_050601 [Datura stramonium]|uniref:Uncharacterized protein n=1 Tax=Datura stramonium TaxID=4076 RepID=A0ABS8SX02_DATST|nr:hypothetical protein [Datura stramonium]